jgi:hypothetical protein
MNLEKKKKEFSQIKYKNKLPSNFTNYFKEFKRVS